MLKKILVGGFVLIMIGAVVAGALALFAPSGEACASTGTGERGAGRGQGREVQNVQASAPQDGQGRGSGGNGQGGRQGQGLGQGLGEQQGQGQGLGQGLGEQQGQGQGLGQGLGEQQGQGSGAEIQTTSIEGETIEGVVLETVELVVETPAGEQVQIGLGPSFYRDAQGFALEVGDSVRVTGYWEDDEFKASLIENLDTTKSIVLRSADGRPMWAGQGRGKNRTF